MNNKMPWFAGSPEGAKRMAIIYSLVATCKFNGVNPYEYFLDILPKAASYSNKNIATAYSLPQSIEYADPALC